MKKIGLIFLLVAHLFSICNAQKVVKSVDNEKQKKTVIGFLEWYKESGNSIEKSQIIKGFNEGLTKNGDSILKVNMNAVEELLVNFKKSNYVSDVFLNNLRQIYKSVSDSLIKHPLVDYFGPVPGLECDPLFGFEPEEILDHIKDGKFTKITTIYDKAIVKFDISRFNQCIFTLTKTKGVWLIDYFGFDRTNADKATKN